MMMMMMMTLQMYHGHDAQSDYLLELYEVVSDVVSGQSVYNSLPVADVHAPIS